MIRTSRLACVAVAAWMIGAAPLTMAQAPSVVQQIPDDAVLFVATPSLSGLSQKVSQFNQQTGLNLPALTDPLAMFRQEMGIEQGLREDGGAALVFLSLPIPEQLDQQPQGGEPEIVVLLPIADYDAFLGNFDAEDAGEGEVTEIHPEGDTMFVKQAGEYAVASNQKELVTDYQTPEEGDNFMTHAGQFGGQVLSESDALVYVDIATLSPKLRPLLEQVMAQAREQMENNPQAAGPNAALAKAMVKIYGGVIDAFLRDGQSTLVGLDVSQEGVGATFTDQFRPDTPLAQAFATSPDEAPSLDRLPSQPFMFAMTANTSTLPMKQWMEAFVDAMPEDNPMAAMIAASVSTMELTGDEQQQAWYAPVMGGAAPSLFNAVTVYTSEQPEELIQKNKQVLTGLNELELGEGMDYNVTYQEDVMQVAGQSVDQYNMRFNLPPEAMQQMGPMGMFLSQGLGGYVTAVEDAVITTSGSDPVMLKEAIAAATGEGKLGDNAGIQAVRSKLTDHRVAEMYIGVGTIMETAGTFMGMFMPGVKMDVPADLPPVGVSISAGNGGVAERIYVPVEVIRAVKDVVDAFGAQGGPGAASRPQPQQVEPGEEHVIELTDANFAGKVVESDDVVLVDFWAVWCGPCKVQSPIVSEVAGEYEGRITVGKLDIDKNPQVSDRYEIQAIPTLLVFRGGEVVKKFVGVTQKPEIVAAIEEAAR